MYRLRVHLRPLTLPLIVMLLLAFSWAQWTNPHVHASDAEVHLHVDVGQAHQDHHHGAHHDGKSFAQVDLSSSGMPAKPVFMPDAALLPVLLVLLALVSLALCRVPVPRHERVYPHSPPHLTPPLRAPPPHALNPRESAGPDIGCVSGRPADLNDGDRPPSARSGALAMYSCLARPWSSPCSGSCCCRSRPWPTPSGRWSAASNTLSRWRLNWMPPGPASRRGVPPPVRQVPGPIPPWN
jgi:hypothetical protein